MAQFGIAADPVASWQWKDRTIYDDPVKTSNKRGRVTFAMSGRKNSRSTQLFINYENNLFLDGQGFAPIGEVVKGMEVVDKLYAGYGEGPPRGSGPSQRKIIEDGNRYLEYSFPLLSEIQSARFVDFIPEVYIDVEAEAQGEFTGIPASFLLVIFTFIGLVFGRGCSSASFGADVKGARSRVIVMSTVVLCVAVPYWIWAAVLCTTRRLDLGVVSFLVAIAASFLARVAALRLTPGIVCCSRICWPLACLLVAANYGLGIHSRPVPWTLEAYYWMGLVWWVLAALSILALSGGLSREAQIRKDSKYSEASVVGAAGEQSCETEDASLKENTDNL
jgi:hypothetical protein